MDRDITAKEFMREFIEGDSPKIRKMDPSSKNTIRHDRWDREDFAAVMAEIEDVAMSQDELAKITPTAPGAIEDTFFGLHKA